MSFSQAFHHMLASSLLLVVLSSALVAAGPVYYENALKSQLTFAAALDRVSIKVPVTLGVMSRCPDALFCEEVFDSVVEEVGFDKVDVTLSFIAKFDETEPKYGVTCMHGLQECDGNVQELCASKHRGGSAAVAEWWPWLQCVNAGGYGDVGNVGRARECAEMSGFEWDGSEGIAECVEGPEGVALLKESVKSTQALGIRKSCTILVSGKTRCVHDGTWTDCEGGHTVSELAQSINDEYARLNDHRDSQHWEHRSSPHPPN